MVTTLYSAKGNVRGGFIDIVPALLVLCLRSY